MTKTSCQLLIEPNLPHLIIEDSAITTNGRSSVPHAATELVDSAAVLRRMVAAAGPIAIVLSPINSSFIAAEREAQGRWKCRNSLCTERLWPVRALVLQALF